MINRKIIAPKRNIGTPDQIQRDIEVFERDVAALLNRLAANTYNDLRVDALSTRPGVVAPTDETGFRGNANFYARNFVHNQADEVQFPVQFDHEWAEGTAVYPHVHFSPWITNIGDAAVRFILEFYPANPFTQFPTPALTYTMTYAWNGDRQWWHLVAGNPTPMATTGNIISNIWICRLYRDNTVANNLAGKVSFLYFDIHRQGDGAGSVQHFTK